MRDEKKSETLEVRLSHSAKAEFMARCKEKGMTASDVVRAFIAGFNEDARRTEPEEMAQMRLKELSMTLKKNPRKIFGTGLGALSAFALFASATSYADDDVFERLDKNQDGKLTASEISNGEGERYQATVEMVTALDRDEDGSLTRTEFSSPAGCAILREEKVVVKNENKTRTVSLKFVAYDLTDAELHKISVSSANISLEGEMTDEEAEEKAEKMKADLLSKIRSETGQPNLCAPKDGAKKKEVRIEKSLEQ